MSRKTKKRATKRHGHFKLKSTNMFYLFGIPAVEVGCKELNRWARSVRNAIHTARQSGVLKTNKDMQRAQKMAREVMAAQKQHGCKIG